MATRAELDALRELTSGGKQWIAAYQAEEVGAQRHCEPEGRLQQGVRLLPRNHARAQRKIPATLHPQADGQERRALHHARAEGIRGARCCRPTRKRGAGIRAVPASCANVVADGRAALAAHGGGAGRSSTCWWRWPSWRAHRGYCRPDDRGRADPANRRWPAPGARCARSRQARSCPTTRACGGRATARRC